MINMWIAFLLGALVGGGFIFAIMTKFIADINKDMAKIEAWFMTRYKHEN